MGLCRFGEAWGLPPGRKIYLLTLQSQAWKKARADSKEWSSFPPATLYYASPSATLTARGCDARTHQPMRHPTNTAPYHARHSFHIPHHAALQHAIAPALHHGGNGAYLDTSQHSCTRHATTLHLHRVHLSHGPPCGERPDSNVPSLLLSSLLSFAFSMLLSFFCRMLHNGALEEPIGPGEPSLAISWSSTTPALREPSATACRTPTG